MLALYVPAGQPLSLPPDGLAAMEQALRQPAGFASDEALRHWVPQTHQLDMHDHTRYASVRTRFNAKLKGPRPSHTKTPDALRAFQATCHEQPQQVLPPETTRPLRVCSQDESRLGLLTICRRLTARGVQPVGPVQHVFEAFSV